MAKHELIENTEFLFIGSNLSLDFVNTAIAVGGVPKDLLTDFNAFIAWTAAARLTDRDHAEAFARDWAGTSQASNFMEKARGFRSVLHEIVEKIEKGREVPVSALETINSHLREQVGYWQIKKTETGFDKIVHADFKRPEDLLVPIAESAADLLIYGDLVHLKKCEGELCVLHFYDTSKNHRRRWCSMAGCGNRAKAKAFYDRRRKG